MLPCHLGLNPAEGQEAKSAALEGLAVELDSTKHKQVTTAPVAPQLMPFTVELDEAAAAAVIGGG
jgi:hypothetical protein